MTTQSFGCSNKCNSIALTMSKWLSIWYSVIQQNSPKHGCQKFLLSIFYAQLIEGVVNKIEFKSPIRWMAYGRNVHVFGSYKSYTKTTSFADTCKQIQFHIEFVQQWSTSNSTVGWKPIPILCIVYFMYIY